MKMKMMLIQFVSNMNLIQMWLMKVFMKLTLGMKIISDHFRSFSDVTDLLVSWMTVSIYFRPITQITVVSIEDILETAWNSDEMENERNDGPHNQSSEISYDVTIVSIWSSCYRSRKCGIWQDIHEKQVDFLWIGWWDFESPINNIECRIALTKLNAMTLGCIGRRYPDQTDCSTCAVRRNWEESSACCLPQMQMDKVTCRSQCSKFSQFRCNALEKWKSCPITWCVSSGQACKFVCLMSDRSLSPCLSCLSFLVLEKVIV
jgi:hypothetical protein